MEATRNITEPLPPLWQRMIMGRNPRRTFVRALVLGGMLLGVFGFILKPLRIAGTSMTPAYADGGVNLLNRLAYTFSEPQRGDVVCVKTTGLHNMYLKRIIGLPGERIAVRDGIVLVDGERLDEPYVEARADWNKPEQQLGPDEYVVVGDNRGMDETWHSWGVISRHKIAGKVLW